MNRRIVDPDHIYTFSDYFRLNYPTKVILNDLGYGYERRVVNLASPAYDPVRVEALKAELEFAINRIGLYSESARKQLVIAPILLELCKTLSIDIAIEYPIIGNPKVRGTLDYYVQNANKLVVIEAKHVDIIKGFTQLAMQMIAIAETFDIQGGFVYGAVTTGDTWKFGIYDAIGKMVTEDSELYVVPKELQQLMNILLGVLE